MIKRFFLAVLALLLLGSVFASPLNLNLGVDEPSVNEELIESDTLSYLFLYIDESSSMNKISYEIYYLGEDSSLFELYLDYNDSEKKICSYNLSFNEGDERYEKVTCEVEDLGEGEYKFTAFLKDINGNVVNSVFNSEFVYGSISVNQEFIDLDDSTQVILHIDGKMDNLRIASRIPKEVIENLNSGNKDDLIISDLDYEILDEDPLIAWSVDEIPSDINYTINKKVSFEDREKFRIEVVENENFKFLNYFVIFLVGMILFFIFRPVMKK